MIGCNRSTTFLSYQETHSDIPEMGKEVRIGTEITKQYYVQI